MNNSNSNNFSNGKTFSSKNINSNKISTHETNDSYVK